MPHVTVGIVITPSKYYVDDGVPAIRSLNVKEGRLTDEDLVFFSDEDNRKLAKTRIYKDDVVIVRTGQTGSCAVVDERFNGTNCIDLIIVRKSRHLRSRFLHYFLASGEAAAEITMSSNGAIQQHFNIGLVREIALLQPSIDDQDAIVAFLDRETAKIDCLMGVRQKQVECLQEQRTAIIHHAVTKGLDPNAKMKPSGVEWLGDIPEAWRICRLKFTARIKNGQDYKLVESDSGYPVMGSGGQFSYAKTYMHDGESVLFGRKGTINKPLYMNERFWTVDTMFYTQIKPVIAPKIPLLLRRWFSFRVLLHPNSAAKHDPARHWEPPACCSCPR